MFEAKTFPRDDRRVLSLRGNPVVADIPRYRNNLPSALQPMQTDREYKHSMENLSFYEARWV